MSNQVTDWGAEQWMGMLFGVIDLPAGYWVALCSSQPGVGSDGTVLSALEPTAQVGSVTYARQELLADDSHWGLSTNGYVGNAVEVDFGVPDVSWKYCPYYAICDAVTDGNVYAFGAFTNPQTLSPLYDVRLPIGAIILKGVSVQASIVT